MDRLPTELVLNILRKVDLPTIYKWKYQNRRLSNIISKYLLFGEVKEMRITGYCRTAILHDDREVIICPEESIPDNLKNLATKIETETVVVDCLIFHELNINDDMEQQFFKTKFARLKFVKHLVLDSANCESDVFLARLFKIYQIDSLKLDNTYFRNISEGFFIKMMLKKAKIDRLSLICESMSLDDDFLNYIQVKEVSYVKISARNILFNFESLILIVQTAIDKNLPIDWSIFVSDSASRDIVDFPVLNEFLKDKKGNLANLREYVECDQKMLQINLPNGRVRLPLLNNSSFELWKADKWNPYFIKCAVVLFTFSILCMLLAKLLKK